MDKLTEAYNTLEAFNELTTKRNELQKQFFGRGVTAHGVSSPYDEINKIDKANIFVSDYRGNDAPRKIRINDNAGNCIVDLRINPEEIQLLLLLLTSKVEYSSKIDY